MKKKIQKKIEKYNCKQKWIKFNLGNEVGPADS